MIRQMSLLAISLCIGACASSAPERSAQSVTDRSAGTDVVASDTASAPPGNKSLEFDGSDVQVSANALAAENSDEIVCRRETPTGSRMTRKVCRTRAEIEAREAKDQESLQRSRATQSGSSCALNQGC